MTKLQKILNDYEILKSLSEKYNDLEFINNNELISRSLGNICDYFEIHYCRIERQYYIKIGIVEMNKKIWVDHAFYFENIDQILNHLKDKNITNTKFVDFVISTAEKYLVLRT